MKRKSRIMAMLLTAVMCIVMLPLQAFAVTGSQVAADGVYSSPITAYKYKYGKLDKSYTGTLNVAVSDGEIAGLWIANASSDKMSKLITNEIYYSYVGQTASESAVKNVSGVDNVSSASVAGSSSSVNSSVKKQYVADIQGAIVSALSKASARSGSASESTSTAAKTVQGTASVSDAEGSKIVLDVGLDATGKIVSLTPNAASISDWSSVVSKNASDYIGKTADEIDAVSGATQYTTAVNEAVRAAMANAKAANSGSSSSGSNSGSGSSGNTGTTGTDSGKTIKPDESATIAVGETVTLDGTHNSMASSESWSSSNTSVATVAASGNSYDSYATVTGVSAGTATITHTINTLFGSSTETFTVIVTGTGGSGNGSGAGSTGSDPVTGVTAIKVTKEWKNDTASDRPASVTVGIYDGSTKVQTLTLNSSNSWTATATGLDSSASYTVKEDAVAGYTTTIAKGETTGGSSAGGWTAQSYGAVEAGKTYAFTYISNGTTYLLGRSGTSVIGTTSGLSGGVPNANIGDDYKWEISKATSGTRYGDWLAKNLGNNYYLAPYNGNSTGYTNSAVLQQSNSYYGNVNLHFDDDGSIWNGYGALNLYATGTSVKSDPSSYTVFKPYLYTSGGSSAQTANYTITNTKDTSGGGTGGGDEGGDEEPADPVHVKSIDPDRKVADNYNIALNVTGQSKTTTSTTQTGETTTSPYDILLVLDNTRSMTSSYGNTTRLAAMKSAAQSFVNGLPAADGSKISMVSFTTGNYNSIVTTDVSWTALSSGKSTVSSKISALDAPDTGYDTYFTQPLERASSLLDSVANDGNKKFVVFFTDGAAAESVSAIQSLASNVKGKSDTTFSIGIVSGSTETQKAQALASESGNYYDVTTAGTMGTAFTNALTTIQSQTTVAKVPMTDVVIEDILSKYVELDKQSSTASGVTISSNPTDNTVTIKQVSVTPDSASGNNKIIIKLEGNLKDDTVYSVNIPVKPSKAAQDEANDNDDAISSFVSNDGATLLYRYGKDEVKKTAYDEIPKVYVAKQVTLTYDANAGTDSVTGMPDPRSETKKVDSDTETASFTISQSEPSRVGYSFQGWAETADATEAIYKNETGKNSISIDEDTTLYAVWTPSTYTVTWMNGASVLEKDENVAYNATPSYDGDEPTKDPDDDYTYTFSGWGTTENDNNPKAVSGLEKVTANITYYAIFTQTPIKKYTVKFVDEDGTEISSAEYTNGTKAADVVKPDDPQDKVTKDETKRFKEWTPEIADVTEDATYTAVYETLTNLYNVTFVDEDGTTVLDGPRQYALGDTPTYEGEEPTKAATAEFTYTFDKWVVLSVTDGPVGTRLKAFFARQNEGIVPVAGNTIYKATYTEIKNKYTVTFVDEDGTTILREATEYEYGTDADSIVQPENPTKAADENNTYSFAGWTPAVADVTGDATYTATYTATAIPTYTVTYKDGVDGSVFADDVHSGLKSGDATPAHDAPTREGYTFKGWDPTVTETVTGDATYTAQWEEVATPPTPDTYTVSTSSTHTYEIYQILKGDYETLDGKDVLTNPQLGSNGKLPDGETLEDALNALKAVADEAAHTDKEQLTVIEKYVNLDSVPVKTVKGGTPATGLEGGYYLIKDKEDWNGQYHASTTYITLIVKDQAFTPKSLRPMVDKQVADDEGAKDATSDQDHNASNISSRWDATWGETADHAINESFQFRLIATIPASAYMKDYEKYKLVFTDTMSTGVTFENIASVTIDGTSIASDKYTVSGVSQGDAGKTWTLTIDDVKTAATGLNIDDGAEVVVTYNAHLNADAITFDASTEAAGTAEVNKNSVFLEYSNNPNTGHDTDMGKTESDHVWVFTYKLNNTKYADEVASGKELEGAKFQIKNGKAVIKLIDNGDGTYTVADQSATEGVITEMTSNNNGKFDVIGLDAGTYTLAETKAPDGYNTVADQTIKIEATHMETDGTDKAALTLSKDSTMALNVVDQSGTVLPSTGGMGTRLFYLFGAILVLGAGVTLITRRRTQA